MKANPLPDLNYLKDCFELDANSPSYLKWKEDRPEHHFKNKNGYKIWKGLFAGKYICFIMKGKSKYYCKYYAVFFKNPKQTICVHRIVYAIHNNTVDFTDKSIDHIDGNSLNNNPENLRLATVSQNQFNRGKQKNNTSGYKNIRIHRGKYECKIQINRKEVLIGRFDTLKEAVEKRDIEGKKLIGDYFRI
jgi:hypothetical protein